MKHKYTNPLWLANGMEVWVHANMVGMEKAQPHVLVLCTVKVAYGDAGYVHHGDDEVWLVSIKDMWLRDK